MAGDSTWQVTPKEAIAIQNVLRDRVVLVDDIGQIRYVAGVDVGFHRASNTGKAAAVVLELPDLTMCDSATVSAELKFPYVPGLLSFREVPLILAAMEQLQIEPDLIICDGQGIAHPRRFGVACHLGLLTDIATIGAAKTRLVGSHDPVPEEKGAWTSLVHGGQVVGAVLRSREKVKPIFVSPGHRVSLETAVELVMACVTRYRLPETTRQAHKLSLFSS